MPRLMSILVLLIVLVAGGAPALGATDDWQDPAVIGRHKQPAHATLVPYATLDQALAGEREASPYYLSLNGDWRFHWVEKPADRPRDFHEPGFDDASWDTLPVPSRLTVHRWW